ncbi:ornithine carbamoyltransferase [Roseateles sp.]|uniref:ornithine carbamoyltransferase n=1 Tax=Roseateles sp. TaxID=1971397 RepID=UPI0032676601
MSARTRHGGQCPDFSDPRDAAALLAQARALVVAKAQAGQSLMKGKRLALVSASEPDETALEFAQAATALGAHVSFLRPGLDERSSARQVDATASMLGRLYDAVECQQLPATLVRRLALGAGIPVFAGLATPGHPTSALVAQLDGDASAALKRRCILQAALLISIT